MMKNRTESRSIARYERRRVLRSGTEEVGLRSGLNLRAQLLLVYLHSERPEVVGPLLAQVAHRDVNPAQAGLRSKAEERPAASAAASPPCRSHAAARCPCCIGPISMCYDAAPRVTCLHGKDVPSEAREPRARARRACGRHVVQQREERNRLAYSTADEKEHAISRRGQ